MRRILPFLALLAAAVPANARAQGIAVEGGGTWIDARDEAVLSWGLGFFLPTGERTIADAHYVQWEEGEGANRLERCGSDGCHGAGMHLLYRVLGSTSYGWFLGGGLDLYERVVAGAAEGEYDSEYVGAYSLATMIARGLTDNVSVYARGVASAHAFETDLRAAYMHVGLVVRLF